jgi:hypothetical protein
LPAAFLRQIKHALGHLKPAEVRAEAGRPVRVGLIASSPETLGRMEAYFAPPILTSQRRAEALQVLVRGGGPACDIAIYESSLLRPAGAFSFDAADPERCVRRIVEQRGDLMLALARRLHPFRKPVSYRVIRSVAKENALFCLATALPDVIPSFLTLPWIVGAYSSDSAFLSVNQVRMAFLLAAASDREVGYREQKSEIASIVAGSFGWRALARELVGKIPLGGGLIPKAAVAWAGTWAVGLSLERLYRLGYGFTREERRAVYEEAFAHGKEVVAELLEDFRKEPRAQNAG